MNPTEKALKLDLSQFATPFDFAGTSILHPVPQDLVDTDTSLRRRIRAEPYKLSIYDQGPFFKPHKDTPRAPHMFGSLVIVFPTPHKGGDLLLTKNGQKWTFSAAEVLVKILPVLSGTRITLTYNLYFKTNSIKLQTPSPLVPDGFTTVKQAMEEYLDNHYEEALLCFGLAHTYPVAQDGSGTCNDALLYRVCQELDLNPELLVYYESDDYCGDSHGFLADDFFVSDEVNNGGAKSEFLEK
ncbi:hypothetical protein GYMLUDRAFT_247122 [Collybiopsis luxurians FD-317 M1]|uniref:Uncharacterized protein n=1 Tax=Collybiopsis luxurians FD-317 M1 TaxID=944289 RepID=A0A0D0BPZ6_9AGAR|nr:hypothetical protein GYMLUDRAFT_247122 [Collybiopsis luxurians FD-317 M1]